MMGSYLKNLQQGDWLLIALIVSVTFLIKLAIPFGGDQIFLAFFIICAVTAYGYIAGILQINALRFSLFFALIGILSFTQISSIESFSLLSLIMVTLVLAPYVFQLKEGKAKTGTELLFFRKIMIVFAVLGIFQFLIQFVVGTYWAFLLDFIIPESLYMQNYFGLRPMSYQSSVYKPTAFFLQEPSHLSQLLTIAIIIEMVYFKNLKYLGIYLISLAMTFSGTGLIPLLMVAPLLLLYQRKIFLFSVFFVSVFTAPLWAGYVGLDQTVNRADEFVTKGSSGYARFIGPYESIRDYQVPAGFEKVVLGMGAGTLNQYKHNEYEVANSTWAKIFFEYGLIGTIAYVGFLFYSILMGRRNIFLIATLMITFWLLGENIFPPTYHALILAFLIWPREKYDENAFNKNISDEKTNSADEVKA